MSALDDQYRFRESERPTMPGAPFMPPHPTARKVGYALIALTLSTFGTFANSLLTNNTAYVAGGFGLTSAEASWLSVAYLGLGASANLFVIKGRVQFGISRILKCGLALYAIAALLAVIEPGFWTAIFARAANGFITSTGVAMSIYYLLEVLPPKARPAAIPIVLGCVQMATPLARFIPVDVVTAYHNRGMHLIAMGVALVQIAMVTAWPLPPTPTQKTIEWRDGVTAALLLPALVLGVGVLGLGRVYWWTDTPWLGWMLICAVSLLAVGVLHEYRREQPMLSLGWIGRADVLRFVGIALIERITLAEQSFGAVGLLSAAGLNSDQFHGLFLVVVLAEIAGIVTAVVTLSEKAIPYQVIAALSFIAVAGWIDSFSNDLTRMPQLLMTQAFIGFGTTLFVGPALLFGVLRVLRTGPQYLVSMVMLFSFTQNAGSLAGTALVSSYQYAQQNEHMVVITGSLDATNTGLARRIAASAAALSASIVDPLARTANGVAAVNRAAVSQGAILGYLDAFRLISAICVAAIVATLIATMRKVRS
jgi:hypothetical protein